MAATISSAADAGYRFTEAQRAYKARIRSFARLNFRAIPGFEKQDLEGELLEVLWLACVSYDPDEGSAFNHYFWTCANRRFLDLHKAASRKMRVGDYDRVSLEIESVNAQVMRMCDASAEDEVIAKLTAREIYNSGRPIA